MNILVHLRARQAIVRAQLQRFPANVDPGEQPELAAVRPHLA